jgi:GNAT superfamily N-acetyltransferase
MSVASGTLGDGQDLHAPAPADGIRPVRRGDEAAILEFLLRALDRGELDGVTRHFLEESIERLGAVTHGSAVAVDGDRIVGWVMPQDDLLVVDPDARRRGHGTRLVAAGQVIAARAGRSHLRLWVPRRDGPETFAHVNGLHYHSSLWQMTTRRRSHSISRMSGGSTPIPTSTRRPPSSWRPPMSWTG